MSRSALLRLLVTLGSMVPVAAVAADAGLSPWSGGAHAQARLVALGPSPGGAPVRRAALEIRLDPGYITYWRQPGEAGLPPTLDVSASDNVAAVDVAFPAPGVFEEAGTALFGYRGGVTLPLAVTLKDPARPARLAVALSYAVCAQICLPGKASLALALPATTDPDAAAIVEAAEAAVPRPAPLGAPGPLAVVAVAPAPSGSDPAFSVAVRAGADAHLFVEGPDGWYLSAGAPTAAAGTIVYPVTATEHPDPLPADVPLRLTLVDATGAIEVAAHAPLAVDAGAAKP